MRATQRLTDQERIAAVITALTVLQGPPPAPVAPRDDAVWRFSNRWWMRSKWGAPLQGPRF